MQSNECLNHPGCLWSCPCDCLNCVNFETVLRKRYREENQSPSSTSYSNVVYSCGVPWSGDQHPFGIASDDDDAGAKSSSGSSSGSFSTTFYDALLPSPSIEEEILGAVTRKDSTSSRTWHLGPGGRVT